MPCPHCGDMSPPGARFCPACGTSLVRAVGGECPGCAAPSLEGARYCWACGTMLSQQETDATLSLFAPSEGGPSRPELTRSLRRFLPAQYLERLKASRGALNGERRVVTILFADVKGSTAIADRMDPEEVLEIMNGAFRVLIEPITRHGGTIARLMGDAVLAFFGAPVAHEDDPDRASRAALEILDGTRRYAEQLEQQRGITGFDVRVGMNTGLVVLAEVGDGDRVEYTAMGDAVNLASRMEAAAEPGTILMTEATRKVLGPRFVTTSVGSHSIRGKTEPVLVHRLLGESAGQRRPGRSHRARLVGRSGELARMRHFLEHVRRGKGGILALTGEAGVGKSRIVSEARRTWCRSWNWTEVGKNGSHRGTGYEAARSILLGLMHSELEPESRVSSSALRDQIDRLDAETTPHLLPYLSLVLGCADQQVIDRLRHLEPEILRARIAQAVGQYLRLVAATGPTGIVWDDFHAADMPSVTLLQWLVPLVREVPVVFLMVYRQEEGPATRFIQQIRSEFKSQARLLRIGPLSRHGSAEMLGALLGRKRIPQAFRKEILEKTQGNALYLEEVVRQLIDDLPRLRPEAAGPGAEGRALRIPDTLRGIVMSRFDALAGPEREALQAASVLGASFEPGLLIEILGAQHSPGAVQASLEELCRRDYLAMEGAPGSPPVYAFSHHLTRQLVAENMLNAQRRALHQRAAEAIERLCADRLDEHARALAVHYELAGAPSRAVDYLLRAIRRAGAMAAAQVVVDLCRHGLALAGDTAVAPEMVCELHERLADALAMLARYQEAIEHYDHAHAPEVPPRARAVLGRKRATVLEKIGRYDDAVKGFEHALDYLKPAMDLPEAARIFLGLGKVYCRQGECGTAIDMSLIALEMVEQEGDDWGVALACNTLGVIHTMAGDLASALDVLRRAEEILTAKQERYDLSATLTNLGWVYHKMGKTEEAAEYLRRGIQLCEVTGNRHGLATASDLLSQVLVARGERREADRYLRKAVKIFAGSGGGDHALVPELWGQMGAW